MQYNEHLHQSGARNQGVQAAEMPRVPFEPLYSTQHLPHITHDEMYCKEMQRCLKCTSLHIEAIGFDLGTCKLCFEFVNNDYDENMHKCNAPSLKYPYRKEQAAQ